MKNIIITFILIINISLIIKAQNGVAGAQELLIPVGARNFGMNNSLVAAVSGIEAAFYNPAGLAKNTGSVDAMFSYMNTIADINLSYAASASNLGDFGVIGISLKTLDIGDIEVTTTQLPYGTGEKFSPTLLVAGLSFGKNLTDKISIGFNTNFIFEKIVETTASGVSFDFGFQYSDVGFNGLSIGALLKNVGPQMQFDGPELLRVAIDTTTGVNRIYKIEPASFPLPTQFEIGIAYKNKFQEKYGILFASSFLSSSYSENETKFAIEFSYDNQFFIRGGYFLLNESADENRDIFGPSFGAGFNIKSIFDITIDYAYRVGKRFSSNQMFTIKMGF